MECSVVVLREIVCVCVVCVCVVCVVCVCVCVCCVCVCVCVCCVCVCVCVCGVQVMEDRAQGSRQFKCLSNLCIELVKTTSKT